MYDITKLKRDATKIKKCFKRVGDSLVVTENVRVMYPEKYESKNLAILDKSVRIVNIFAILDDNGNYAVNNIPIFINLTPNVISHVTVNNELYKVLEFEEGQTYTDNVKLVVDNKFLYDLFSLFYINGKIPWFMDYDDVINIFRQTAKYARTNLGSNTVVSEILASILAKDPADRTKLFRDTFKGTKITNKPEYIGLMNPYYTFDNTVSKIGGSYYSKGLMGGLIDHEKNTTKIEEILRS